MALPNRFKTLNAEYEIALYIHIPFCKSKCIYCDFYSVTQVNKGYSKASLETIENHYITRLIEEYDRFIKNMQNITIRTVYIGGGTPSLLKITALERLFKAIITIYEKVTGRNFTPEEWTVEANPESLSYDFINLCKAYPITRISLGIQTLKSKFLRILNRPGNLNDNFNAIDAITKKWEGDINFDVISGIPGGKGSLSQTEKELLHDLNFLVDFNPSHISLYSLTVEKGTPLYTSVKENKIELPDPEDADRLWFAGKYFLEERGYKNYEISNFAKEGKESRHNLSYWELNPYLGLGPSAVSTLPLTETNGQIITGRLTYLTNLETFLKDTNSTMKIEKLTSKDFLFENLMMGFRLKRGINKETFKKRFKNDLFKIIPQLNKSPCFERDFHYYRLTEECRFLLNKFLIDVGTQMEKVPESQIQVEWPLDKLREK